MKKILAEIISIGDELLNGQTINTNASWIAFELDAIGIRTNRITTVSDTKEAISTSLKNATKRADLIVITGGLGPTKDDITKKTISDFFGSPLVRNKEHLEALTRFFFSKGRPMNDLNKAQADIPLCATRIPNDNGTAPGMWIEHDDTIYISMAGVPREMKHMMMTYLLPKIATHFNTPIIKHYFAHVIGIGESDLSILIEDWENNLPTNIKLAYLPSLGWIKLRLTVVGDNITEIDESIEAEMQKLRVLIPTYLFSEKRETIEETVGRLLKERNLTIGTAESCTGGYIAHQITRIPGSSSYFKGSIISYSNEVKQNELGVTSSILEKYGAVSEQTVQQMAEGLRKKLNVDIAIACSGIAGPEGGTTEKPVGTVWIAYADNTQTITKLLRLSTDRSTNIELTSLAALNLVRKTLAFA